jgi:FkbM family methyltransferase
MTLPHYPKLTATEIAGMVGSAPLVLEIGAADGEDTVQFLWAMPKARLYCFEPDERAYRKFAERMRDAGMHDHRKPVRFTLYYKGVTDVDGDKPFWPSGGKAGHLDDWYYSGSYSQPTYHKERSPEIKFPKKPVTMPSIRLDTWLNEMDPDGNVNAIDFVWADVQGGQVAMIAGARMALAITRFLYIECHEQPLYADEPTQEELITMLRPEFEPLGIYERNNILFRNKYVS